MSPAASVTPPTSPPPAAPPSPPPERALPVAVDDSSRAAEARADQDRGTQRPSQRVAVLVCHGMGQQVPFETIDRVATHLAAAHEAQTGIEAPVAVAQVAAADGTFLPRAEVRLVDTNGMPVIAHVYEAYWASVPEGKVRLWDTLTFLFGAGWRGARFAYQDGFFDRWMFGGRQEFEIPARRVLELLLATWVVAVLAVAFAGHALLAVAVLAVALRAPWPDPDTAVRLASVDIALVVDLGLVAALGWALAQLAPRSAAPSRPRTGHDTLVGRHAAGWWVRQQALAITIGALVLAGVGAAAFAWWLIVRVRQLGVTGAAGIGVVLLALAGSVVQLRLRWVLVEFLGDVAAYVSAYNVSRFQDVRREIQRVARLVARQVYGAGYDTGTDPSERYDAVCMVGHSLGSVLAYDALNDAINRDQHARGWFPDAPEACYDVARRTRLLLTFGSPLDKTAFIFRTQRAQRQFDVREALAAAVQPLIADADYGARPQHWINIWSRWDWVSGALDYYDPPAASRTSRAVLNIEARTSRLPWHAHTDYIDHPLVAGVLHAALTGQLPPDVGPDAFVDPAQLAVLRAAFRDGESLAAQPTSAAGGTSTGQT